MPTKPLSLAEKIVEVVLEDLLRRSGVGYELMSCDEDVQREIRKALLQKVQRILEIAMTSEPENDAGGR